MTISESTFWFTRFYFQRALAAIYAVGFLILINQFLGLCGSRGLQPVSLFLDKVRFWDAPSLFWLNHSDTALLTSAWIGFALSVFALIGLSDAYGSVVSILTWTLLWIIYSSFVNIGQVFYGFGWEILLLETGFLAIFMGSSSSKPSLVMIFLLRWLLFRLMMGAGLIKIRGDECWRDLTCMKYHYETMPMPGPTSWFLHYSPMWINKAAVLFNHFAELIVPFFYFAPRPWRHAAGFITIAFHAMIILTGNFSWLNYVTIVIALACFDDTLFQAIPKLGTWAHAMGVPTADSVAAAGGFPSYVIYGLAGVIGLLSLSPVMNMISSKQMMNTSFEPFHLVNTYGAFGSITRTRDEIILEGADSPGGPWKEYEFKGKPGNVSRMPPLVSPYHFKLDWQMWFAAMSPYYYHPWILNLAAKLLDGEPQVLALMDKNPFADHPPKYVRAELYEYHYTQPGEADWWSRERKKEYLPPLSLDDPQFISILKQQGWRP